MSDPQLQREIAKRRTFAIISHPDAGKTTITEKLLLIGGAIQMAGTVKARKAARYATSDWMELERQRGISVTTSVMRIDYDDFALNLLDTPGHNDFSEDTYRTLTAVDSALMLIDHSKGVEKQTIKLMDVCRMRNTPIVTFMNKLDRAGLDPLDLLDNVEKVLNISCCPMTWPITLGGRFRGVYELTTSTVHLFDPKAPDGRGDSVVLDGLDDTKLDDLVGETAAAEMREDLELIVGAGVDFDRDAFLGGHQTPVFFGSALNGFGVEEMLQSFVTLSPGPGPRATEERTVEPDESKFTGFCFKIQANMDPNHRDRIAFVRICSGKFTRGQKLKNVRLGRDMKIASPIIFMARERDIAEEAWPGDILGLHDTGTIEIGDTFTMGESLHFTGIPAFAPEILRRVTLENPLRAKNLKKGLEQLAQEGAVQLFRPLDSPENIVGVVGALQLDVLKARLEGEYDVQGRFETIQYTMARWYHSDDKLVLAAFEGAMGQKIARDVKDRPVFLAESNWRLNLAIERHPEIQFFTTSDGLIQATRRSS